MALRPALREKANSARAVFIDASTDSSVIRSGAVDAVGAR